MLKDFVEKQRQSINYFLDHLDFKQTEKLIHELLAVRGMIFFTGVGKSAIIANKIAVTMVSTGTRAIYLSPTDALHGDLGMVGSEDAFIFFSKSGESDELLNLLPAIRNKGAKMIAIVCNSKSRLSSACHFSIDLPFISELCPFNLAPTTSAAVQLMFGDLLAVALMSEKQFSQEDFIQNHPGGRIGKRLTMKVKDLMLCGGDIPFCSANDKLMDVLVELSNKRCGCVIIVDKEQKMEGIFTDGDLRRSLQSQGGKVLEKLLLELMNKGPRWIEPESLAWEAMKSMEADPLKPVMVLPVLDSSKKVIGLIKMHDILQSGL